MQDDHEYRGHGADDDTADHDALLTRAIGGDRQALSELLTIHGPRVRRRLQGRIGRKYQAALDVDDVLQVTYVEAFARIRRFEPGGPNSLTAWLHAIAEHNLLDALKELDRKKRPPRDRQVSPPAHADSYISLMAMIGATSMITPSREAVQREAQDLIDKALTAMPQDYGQVLLLYHFEGLGAEEVARRMNRSIGAVYMLRARALEHLKGKLPAESAFFTRGH